MKWRLTPSRGRASGSSVVPSSGSDRSGIFTTGVGQVLHGVHLPEKCEGQACVIHAPSEHAMRAFPTAWRVGLGTSPSYMVRVCPHGYDHPDPDDPLAPGLHACCGLGCCQDTEKIGDVSRHDRGD